MSRKRPRRHGDATSAVGADASNRANGSTSDSRTLSGHASAATPSNPPSTRAERNALPNPRLVAPVLFGECSSACPGTSSPRPIVPTAPLACKSARPTLRCTAPRSALVRSVPPPPLRRNRTPYTSLALATDAPRLRHTAQTHFLPSATTKTTPQIAPEPRTHSRRSLCLFRPNPLPLSPQAPSLSHILCAMHPRRPACAAMPPRAALGSAANQSATSSPLPRLLPPSPPSPSPTRPTFPSPRWLCTRSHRLLAAGLRPNCSQARATPRTVEPYAGMCPRVCMTSSNTCRAAVTARSASMTRLNVTRSICHEWDVQCTSCTLAHRNTNTRIARRGGEPRAARAEQPAATRHRA
jgi:hypothetical protein